MRRARQTVIGLVAVAAVLCAVAPLQGRLSRTIESQLLNRISTVSRKLESELTRLMFRDGFMSANSREALNRTVEWAEKNKFPDFKDFVDTLRSEDIDLLFSIMKEEPLGSSPDLPVVQDLWEQKQSTVLTFPFDGEMFVIQGNDDMISHLKNSSNAFAWDFVIMRDGSTFTGNSGRNEKYHAWDTPVIAPAPGKISRVVNDKPDHPPLTTKMGGPNYVVIDHENGEFSRIYHLKKGSIVVKPGDRVTRGQLLGRVGDSGTSMFPHIHYQLDHDADKGTKPATARFACYFVRDNEKDPALTLAVSDIPARGEFVRNVPPSSVVEQP